jgi:hypothetical protein
MLTKILLARPGPKKAMSLETLTMAVAFVVAKTYPVRTVATFVSFAIPRSSRAGAARVSLITIREAASRLAAFAAALPGRRMVSVRSSPLAKRRLGV